jgi:hypothetical protein
MKRQMLKSDTIFGFLLSVGLTYILLIFGNFLYEICFFYFYPGSQIYTEPQMAENIIEAVVQAKDETIEVVKHRPVELLVVSAVLGICVFIIIYGPLWDLFFLDFFFGFFILMKFYFLK